MTKQTTPATPDALILQTTGTLAQATEVIKQLVDATAAVEWVDLLDDGNAVYCVSYGLIKEHAEDCELDAQLTKARAFLDGLGA